MSAADGLDRQSVVGEALAEIRELRTALGQSRREHSEPIAIVGMACRLPGADGPAQFWDLLREGRDATSEMRADRWDLGNFYDPDPKAPGKMHIRRCAALDDVDMFDAPFFGVPAREAARMDPQQRLFLEVAWEALEHAGRAPDKLAGSRTGVFLGVTGADYVQSMMQHCDPSSIDAYWLTGITSPFAAGRLSYWLGLRGPSLTVDTACSSALVSVHLACQSLRSGDCTTALAGGVNVLISPEWFVVLSKANMMAPDGRCKTFDSAADGYARGEGCGVVVLKRLSDAVADNDRVLAVIRGSAVNQDGRSGGITVPNGQAQQAVIRDALHNAGVEGSRVDYIEAHGTGTALGDPIEVRALSAVLGTGRDPAWPVALGSVKTNIGHLESAAGVAGLIKTVLSLRHRQIPPLLHLKQVNPQIPLDTLPVTIPTTLTDWPRHGRSRIAGVSSFGASGTNAHVVLEEAPDVAPVAATADRTAHLLSLSARSAEALTSLAARYRDHVGSIPADCLPDLFFTANRGRAKFGHRAAVCAATDDQAREALDAHAAGRSHQNLLTGTVKPSTRPKVAFLFTGQGSQYPGMGHGLYRSQPSFREDLDHCDDLLGDHLGSSLLSVLFPTDGTASPIDQTCWTQPALFSLEYALARLWRRWGAEPVAVLGHSVGEYAAACVSGVLSLEDGLALMAERGRLMHELPAGGGMCALLTSPDRVERALAPYQGILSIAALNGPANVVVSGASVALAELTATMAGEGIHVQPLTVSHAFHSVLLEPMLADFEKRAAQVSFAAPRVPLVSNLTGRFADDSTFDARYLRDHAREPVRFLDGVRELVSYGCTTMVEIGPAPVLSGMARHAIEDQGICFLPSLRRGVDDDRLMLRSLGEMHVRGIDVDWDGFDRDHHRRIVDAPTYPFQRQHHWFDATAARAQGPAATTAEATPVPPAEPDAKLLGKRVESPLDAIQFRSLLTVEQHPGLSDCVSDGAAVVNAGFYLEAVLEAVEDTRGFARTRVEHLVMPQALVMPDEGTQVTQLVIEPAVGDRTPFRYYSHRQDEDTWALHAQGTFSVEQGRGPDLDRPAIESIQRRCPVVVSATAFYRSMWKRKLYLGPSARWIDRMVRGNGEVFAWLRPAEQDEAGRYLVHPGITDSALQLLIACLATEPPAEVKLLLTEVERVSVYAPADGPLLCHAVLREGADRAGSISGDLRLVSDTGVCIAELTGVVLTKTSREAVLRAAGTARPAQVAAAPAAAHPPSAAGAEARRAFQQGNDIEGTGLLRALLTARISATLGGQNTELDGNEPLQDLGLDSLLAVELKDAVAGELGLPLPAAMFMDNPTLAGLETKLRPLLHGRAAARVRPARHQPTGRSGPGGMHVVELGTGPPVVFVHGGAVSGLDAWQTQMSLADSWRLIVPSRLNYGSSAASEREDFAEDAELIAALIGDGAHLVGQSYGAVGVMLAAARRPEAVRSLTLIESGSSEVARGNPVVDEFERALRALVGSPPDSDEDLFRAIFDIIDPGARFPTPLAPALLSYAGRTRDRLRWPWDAGIPLEKLRRAAFPKLVVSGGRRPVFEAISDALTVGLDATRLVIPGGHATQNVGSAFNDALEAFLTRAENLGTTRSTPSGRGIDASPEEE